MVKHVLIALNIEFEVMFESFAHNFARLHILYTNMQKDVATKYTYFTAYNGRTCINGLKY